MLQSSGLSSEGEAFTDGLTVARDHEDIEQIPKRYSLSARGKRAEMGCLLKLHTDWRDPVLHA